MEFSFELQRGRMKNRCAITEDIVRLDEVEILQCDGAKCFWKMLPQSKESTGSWYTFVE